MPHLKDITEHSSTRRSFFKLAGSVSAATAFAASIAACGSGSKGSSDAKADGAKAGEINKDGTITAGIAYDISTTFAPSQASGAGPLAANIHIFEGLYGLDPASRKRYNALATADPEKIDDTTYRVTLREGAKFHNGDPVKASDVVYTYGKFTDKSSLFAQFLYFIDSVNAVDDSTVEFKFNQPFSLFADRISLMQIMPESAEKDFEAFGAHPIGSGPYKFVSATKGDHIEFARFDEYNGPRPALAKAMNWSILSDAAARVTAIQSKRVQAVESVPYDNIAVLENTSGLSVESVQSFGLLFMMFNCEKEPFNKVEVRQALFYALDMDKVIKTALLGNAEPATSFLQKSHPDYVEASTVYTHDADKAKKLLKDAGVEDLTLTVRSTDHDWVVSCVQLIQESLKEAGIKATIEPTPSSSLYSDYVDTGNFDVLIAPGDPSVFGNDVDLLLSWWYRGDTWPTNRFRWSGTEQYKQLQEYMNAATTSSDPKAEWKKAFDLLSDNVPLYPLFHRKLPTAWDSETLVDFKPLPTTGISMLGVGTTK
ncbi:ABC transporter substrate-binding protein [Rothia sp. P7181]|uniref:ABC transporter substrate-binding protein n=1 Tax=unclassified Rothia (in: high G+C Gram-positive bacteria) TaxID=2689056 RepID=UPI003ABFB575